GIYNLDEAKKRIADHQATIVKAEGEIQRLQARMKAPTSGMGDIVAMREELKALRDRNLDEATFEEKLDIVSKLGINVYPSEDLASMRVCCWLNLERMQAEHQNSRTQSNEIQADGECESLTGCRKVYNVHQ
ncbi:MAG: hypothetical protein DRI01_08135, partial [Chloroflexi bacterium]